MYGLPQARNASSWTVPGVCTRSVDICMTMKPVIGDVKDAQVRKKPHVVHDDRWADLVEVIDFGLLQRLWMWHGKVPYASTVGMECEEI